MRRIRIEARTDKSFEQFRKDLDGAIEESFAAAFTGRKWNDHTLHTAAPATQGVIQFEGGVIRAEVRISFPATAFEQVIVEESCRILAEAGGGAVERVE